MTSVLVDTGAWIALLSSSDQYAKRATAHYRELVRQGARLVTTNYVIDEAATRLRYGAGVDAALVYRRMLLDSVAQRRLRIAWVDEAVEADAWRLLEQFRDVPLSLTDATTGVVARREKLTEIFGFDRDFEALGLVVLPGPGRVS